MTRSLWLRLDAMMRTTAPSALAFIFVLAGAIPLNALEVQILKPLLPIAAVYYWALYRPDLLPAPVAFLLGLMVDILSGAPLGVYALAFTLAHGVLRRQRRFLVGKSFAINWLGFALVAVGGSAMAWLLTSLIHGAPVGAAGLLFQTLTTVAVFPVVFWLLLRCHVAIIRQV